MHNDVLNRHLALSVTDAAVNLLFPELLAAARAVAGDAGDAGDAGAAAVDEETGGQAAAADGGAGGAAGGCGEPGPGDEEGGEGAGAAATGKEGRLSAEGVEVRGAAAESGHDGTEREAALEAALQVWCLAFRVEGLVSLGLRGRPPWKPRSRCVCAHAHTHTMHMPHACERAR